MSQHLTFHIVCVCYNAEDWIERCINSIKNQTYRHFQFHLHTDNSTDNTLKKALTLINHDDRFFVLQSTKRKYASMTRWEILKSIENRSPKDIVVLLDGDDWLNGDNVLQKLSDYYQNNKVVLTHGNYITDSGDVCKWSEDYSEEEKTLNLFRYCPWISTHVRTFKLGLFAYFSFDFLLDDQGKPFRTATDFALFLPLLELAGTYSMFLDDPLYVYNERDGLAMDSKRILTQLKNESQIRDREPLKPLSRQIIESLL